MRRPGDRGDRRSCPPTARETLIVVAVFALVVLINGSVAVYLITLLQALGLWEAAAAAQVPDGIPQLPPLLTGRTLRGCGSASGDFAGAGTIP
jgi:hypothetical protein